MSDFSALAFGGLPLNLNVAAIRSSSYTSRRREFVLAGDLQDGRVLAFAALSAGSDLELVFAAAFSLLHREAGSVASLHR